MKRLLTPVLLLLLALTGPDAAAQRRNAKKSLPAPVPQEIFTGLSYRNIGPFRGGRVAAVEGIEGNGELFYMGATGGGVWKTTNSGETWINISDGFFGGTIGAVDVADSDNNIIYAAGGEKTVRGNVSHGYGIWKSVDAGESWEYSGLAEGQYIPRLRIHPRNPDIVYAAVLGHLFGPNSERGIYRTTDGGVSWEKILYVDENSGGIDLILDPSNPRIIYASTWQVRRTPYSLESGGPGSALWKSKDGGDTWTRISENPGMPEAPVGIIGVTLSKANNKKIYALVEAEAGGLFASEDGGDSWRRINDDRNLRQRAWYYTRLYADPADENTLYVLNVQFHKSTDGGRSFTRIGTPHGDHHDLWIDPSDSRVMIIGDDGGAQVTSDGGERWSTMMNQPTSQFYRVITDNHFPYRIYGAQQDNSTVRIASSTFSGGITESDWESTAGGESGWIAPDPSDNDIVYGGSYGGYLQRYNHRTGESRRVDIWPDNPMGWGADSLKQRFQWNFPILFSRHNPKALFAASNMLFVTENGGDSWTRISPDLTRDDKSRMGPSGGPITKDNTSVEYYGTIFTVAESATESGVIWTGSDDGLIHITRDGGESWTDVTPPASLMPEWSMINSIEAHPTVAGGIYVAATRYKSDDFTPYLLRSNDYGATWTLITEGIDPDHFTRVIRADPVREGLLYCGTESGVYISFSDGELWQPFQLNLPVVPVTDITIKDNDLIIATQGRSFWVFDYLDIVRQITGNEHGVSMTAFTPDPFYRVGGGRYRASVTTGENPLSGMVVPFFISGEPGKEDMIRVDIRNSSNNLVKSFRTDISGIERGSHQPVSELTVKEGMNLVSWDLICPGVLPVENMILWGGNLRGAMTLPGDYTARIVYNNDSADISLKLLKNPLYDSSQEDLKAQFDFLTETGDKLTEVHKVIKDIRELRTGISDVSAKLKDAGEMALLDEIRQTGSRLTAIEEALYQTKNRSSQDPLNYPIKLGNKLAALRGVVATGDYRPTAQAYEVRDELTALINIQLERFYAIRDSEIPGLNLKIREAGIDYLD